MVPREDVQKEVQEQIERTVKLQLAHTQRRLDEIQAGVNEFEQLSGLRIRDGWNRARMAEAVRFVMENGEGAVLRAARNEAMRAREYAEKMESFLQEQEAAQ